MAALEAAIRRRAKQGKQKDGWPGQARP